MSKYELIKIIKNIYPNIKEFKNKSKSDLIKIIKIGLKSDNKNKYNLIKLAMEKYPKLKGISKLNKDQLLAILN